jgi:AraC-like DNA-binding protein
VQHVEFFHKDHFERYYHRVKPAADLSHLIDFFWETEFERLWTTHPKGFSDALFPNIGYTYLINLGTPFVMQVADKKFEMKTDGFLPRQEAIECYHQPGNKLFGIKFRISPVIFEKKINFGEYREYIYPLSYLLEQTVIDNVKKAKDFKARVELLSNHFRNIISKNKEKSQAVKIVSTILDRAITRKDFETSIEEYAKEFGISTRTLHRYFEMTTSLSSKKALQVLRIRKAVEHIAEDPKSFRFEDYGYYDHSHFYKHLKKFTLKKTLKNLQPHLRLLEKLHNR